ncbi:hypothetical protein D9615_005905 [Tricholomella constricta]|uniref:Cytochrome P450 n=1 Tax=Tricholomella constricta TaxID=117010 RepID=A0A8H5H9F6_9AGAR|nr:hypothetical protein D9615_005905 [Tricholomella constricta]
MSQLWTLSGIHLSGNFSCGHGMREKIEELMEAEVPTTVRVDRTLHVAFVNPTFRLIIRPRIPKYRSKKRCHDGIAADRSAAEPQFPRTKQVIPSRIGGTIHCCSKQCVLCVRCMAIEEFEGLTTILPRVILASRGCMSESSVAAFAFRCRSYLADGSPMQIPFRSHHGVNPRVPISQHFFRFCSNEMLGLQSAADAFLSAGLATQLTLGVVLFLVIVLVTSSLQADEADAPTSLPCYSIFTIMPFFGRRYDFLNWGFQATGQSVFQFKLLRNTVIVVSGERARQAFFTAKGLDLTEGFKILSGAIPMVRGVTSNLEPRRIAMIHKRLAAAQRNAPLNDLIPLILDDARRIMETWGTSGKFDPFDSIYTTTLRSLSCSEISDNPMIVARLKTLYDTLDNGTTPATVLVPWFPTPAMIKKLWATKEIFEIVNDAIHAREQSGISRNDTLQMLLDSGDEKLVVVGFIMGLLIAGARATGTTASWMMTFLGCHPEWRAKAAAEVECLLAANTASTSDSDSLSSRFATIPLKVWESETPILDAIIKETTRVAQPHTAMRRNLGPPVYIDGKIVPTGAYVVYPFSDVHLDPALYPDPWAFNPGREEVKHTPFAYVGWGGGKTLCLGTRLAKVELKLIAAMFLLGFHHSVIDKAGNPTKPTPNWNDILLCRPPPEDTGYISYERSDIPL